MSEKRKFQLDKLVRDGIVESNLQQGISVDYRVVQGVEKLQMMLEKLVEEAQEASASRTRQELAAELSGIIDLANAIIRHTGISIVTHDHHTYSEGHFINSLIVPNDNEWAEYYAKDPQRFPEIIE